MKLCWFLLLMTLSCPALAQEQWRWDGTGSAKGATPPLEWTTPAWSVPLTGITHASPVLADGRVFVSDTPTALVAVDAVTGRQLWRHSHAVVDALPAAEAEPIRALLTNASQLEKTLEAKRKAYGLARREQRAKGAAAAPDALEALSKDMVQIQDQLASIARYRNPPTGDLIGWASPTAVTDESAVYALFANGVVVRRRLEGELDWIQWLGASTKDKKGYHEGNDTASLLRADDLLIVPYGKLRALDANTGATRWEGPKYPHFGTPAIARVGGRTLVLTPDGLVVDARDGKQVASGLGALHFTGPHVQGDVVLMVGGLLDSDGSAPNYAQASRLSVRGKQVNVTPLWKTELPPHNRIYSTPVVHKGRVFATTNGRLLYVLDLKTGEILHERKVGNTGEHWASLILAGDRLFVPNIKGRVYELDPNAPTGAVRTHLVSPGRTTPLFVGGRVYWRGEDALTSFALRP